VNLSDHNADLLVSTLTMADRSAGAGATTATMTFDEGTLVVDALVMARRTGTGTGNATATLNLGDSVTAGTPTTTIGTIDMAINTSSGGTVAATLNITGGSVAIGTGSGAAINMANAGSGRTVTSDFNITGGNVTLSGDIVRTGGAGTENATVKLDGGTLDMAGHSIGSSTSAITLDAQSGTLKDLGELNGGGTLTKSGTGLLVIEGANGYTGGTNITDGTVELRGSLSTGAVTVSETGGTLANAAVLASGGNGATTGVIGGAVTVGSVGGVGILKVGGNTGDDNGTLTLTASGTALTIMDGSQLQLGITSPSTASTITFINGVYVFNGNNYANAGLLFSDGTDGAAALAAYNVAPASDEHDYLNLTGSLDMSVGDRAGALWGEGSVVINPVSFNLANVTYGQVFNLIDWMDVTGSISGSFDVGGSAFVGAGSGNVSAGDMDLPELGGNYAWDVSAFQSHGILVVVPEPSRALLLLGGLLAMIFRRRR
jgi:autotransporter-associated beta strand protein